MINQRHINNFQVDTIAELKTLTGRHNLLTFCTEAETWYRYEANGGLKVANDTSVCITGNGGDTRWLAVAGTYSYYKAEVAQKYVKDFSLTDWVGLSAPYQITVLASEHKITNNNNIVIESFEQDGTNKATPLYFEINNIGDVTLYTDTKFDGYSVFMNVTTGAVLGQQGVVDGGYL